MENKTEYAKKLLLDKFNELGRLPKRTDFDSETVCFIKQKLGPWPRALEAVGLKQAPTISSKEKSKAKRNQLKTKRNKNEK